MKKTMLLFFFSFANVGLACDRDSSIGIFSAENNKAQEDTSIAIKKEGITFLGVFDGHGGCDTAFLLQRDFHKFFFERIAINSCLQGKTKVKDALCGALKKIEIYALETFTDGSTVAVACKKNNSLHILNVGDSSLILEKNGEVCFFQKAHDLEDEVEFKRVLDAQGQIFRHVTTKNDKIIKKYDWRINGLNMTRSIGDVDSKGKGRNTLKDCKRQYSGGIEAVLELYPSPVLLRELIIHPKIGQVIADPDYRKIKLTEENRWLILATDGFSDFVKHQDAINMVIKYNQENKTTQEIAKRLVGKAIELGSKDNVTVIVHDLYVREK